MTLISFLKLILYIIVKIVLNIIIYNSLWINEKNQIFYKNFLQKKDKWLVDSGAQL